MKNLKRGFTLIELLVVVAIIGILASVVLAALSNAKNKGADAAIKSNLKNAVSQAEVFYLTNTVAPNNYTNVCSTTSPTGGANTITALVTAAAKAAGLSGSPNYTRNGTGTGTTATCNDGTGVAWAAEVPLAGSKVLSPKMWCVDSTGKSKQESTTIGAGTSCA